MYLIPKNIKVKKEIFKGFGIVELIAMAISITIGFTLQKFFIDFRIKVFLCSFFPLATFLLLLPLPNGSTSLIIIKKFIKFRYKRKIYMIKQQ